jgi:aldehyde dehydrogenase (NAD+)
MLMAARVAPALLAGCTVVMKPSPESPLEAYIMAECAEEAGLPAGVFNLVTAERAASEHLVRNVEVDQVSFTGSTATGSRIASVCGERIARCSLELGGKSAVLVHDDMEIAAAARILAGTIVLHSGQICEMLSRAIVPRHRHDELAEAIAREMSTIRVGHSDDPETRMGPVAMKRQLDRVEAYVRIGKEEGASLVYGGRRPAHLPCGYFHEPTLFANVTATMRIAQEEIFGPVLSLMPCEDIEDGIRIANDTKFGLNGSVLSHNSAEVYRIARQMRTGKIGQNGLRIDFSLPFGGFKQSGIGRGGGAQGLMSYLETKTILLDDAKFVPVSQQG